MEIKCYMNKRCVLCTLVPPCSHMSGSVQRSPFRTQNNSIVKEDSVDSLFEPSAWADPEIVKEQSKPAMVIHNPSDFDQRLNLTFSNLNDQSRANITQLMLKVNPKTILSKPMINNVSTVDNLIQTSRTADESHNRII